MLIKTEIERSKEDLLKKIRKKSKIISNTVGNIIKHKNTKLVKLSDNLILLGIRRSLLMKRPYTPQLQDDGNKNSKSAYLSVSFPATSSTSSSISPCMIVIGPTTSRASII